MPDLLYLDTARLGRMTPAAQRAERALVSVAAEEGASAYFERFVRDGASASHIGTREHHSALGSWAGIGELKQALRSLAGQCSGLPVLLAHRSTLLMKLGARVLFHSCRNVLITDLGWPGYHDLLAGEAKRVGRRVTAVELRTAALSGRLSEGEVTDRVCEAFERERCDGLFLSAVSNWGVRLPVERIARRLEASHRVWYVVVDGAQEFCHTPGRLDTEYCDLYLTGCHKWLGAHHPMGLGFFGRLRSRRVIEDLVADMTRAGDLDDPLLRFSAQLETGTPGPIETLNLLPLFTTRAAIADAQPNMTIRAENMRVASEFAPAVGWKPMLPDLPLRSGILLLEPERPAVRSVPPDALRTALRDAGVAATTYEGGFIRLSMPATPFTPTEREQLSRALHAVA